MRAHQPVNYPSKRHVTPLPRRQRGLTMIEMIIATALSITLLGGVYQIYNGNKRSYTLQDELARLQENARFAMEFISQDIRKAGYTGCMRGAATMQNNVATDVASFDPFTGLQGWEAEGTDPQQSGPVSIDPVGATSATTIGTDNGWNEVSGSNTRPTSTLSSIPRALPDSDIIRVWFANPQAQAVTSIVGNTINLSGSLSNVNTNDVIVVSDCGRVDYVQQCGTNNSIIEATADSCTTAMTGKFLTVNSDSATARRLDAGTYYVAKMGAADSPTGLYNRRLNGTSAGVSQLVSEGIENMQILYGEDTGNDNVADRYRTAADVLDWNKVVNVRISLLMSTADNIASKTYQGSYELNGVTLEPQPDRRIRRVFTSNIALRNRV